MNVHKQGFLKLVFAASLMTASFAGSSKAGDNSYYLERNCNQLWYERNSIYADAGYCFKSYSAIRVFGRRCYSPYGRLHIGQKSTVRNIKRAERIKGC